MKESIKEVLLMGLGAISLTGEKANELKKEELVEIINNLSDEEKEEIKELLKTEKESSKENTDDEDGKE